MPDQHRTAGEASATGGSTAASPDAASVEEHLSTDKTPASRPASSESAPARTSGAIGRDLSANERDLSANEEETSANGEEATSVIRRRAPRGGLVAGPTSGPESDDTLEDSTGPKEPAASGASAARGEGKAGAATGEEPTSDARAAHGIRSRASRRGRGAVTTASTEGKADGAAAPATASADAGGNSPGAGGGFPGRPNKPVLAGAAMTGAILIAVPLLVMATYQDDDKGEKVNSSSSADTVLGDDGAKPGAFVAASPSPEKPKAGKEKKEPPKKSASPAAKSTLSPSKSAKAAGKKHTAAKKTASVSNLPSVMTHVLIKNNENGTCVDIPGFASGPADGPITQATCNSNPDDNQLWNVEKKYDTAGPGGAPLFQIRNVVDSHCLDLGENGGRPSGTKVTEFPCNGTTSDNQLWWLDKQADGKFWIRNFASNNQCLDSFERDSETRDLMIWPCAPEGQNNHEWIFTRK
ncbi:RICIN domain-containing protein [Streptomyces sp. NBRC 110028]|uniref:RICIN domain-containing protein n=1 Tax=Streptomyces sp. NBRC 110028 TaxID=1621260 RepID=UPI0006E13ED1|nr:RICIN domain-containing protein [Streptomyces sp. NBRC 110028]